MYSISEWHGSEYSFKLYNNIFNFFVLMKPELAFMCNIHALQLIFHPHALMILSYDLLENT